MLWIQIDTCIYVYRTRLGQLGAYDYRNVYLYVCLLSLSKTLGDITVFMQVS